MSKSKPEPSIGSSENTRPREKSSAGFYKRRRGVFEHIEAGTIDLLENGIHDYLSLRANLVIGSSSSIPAGVCFISAPALRPLCKRWVHSDRTMQRIIDRMEQIGWIKTWPKSRGNYPTLICRATVHDLSGNEYRVNGEKTTDWRHPAYEPVGQLSPNCPQVVQKLASRREVRKEKGEEDGAAASALKRKGVEAEKKAWEAVEIQRCGSPKFISAWEHIYEDRPDDEPLSVTMERCIQHCLAKAIGVPPPFFCAKRRVEKQESEDDSEVRRFAGPRGVAPEFMR